MRKSHGQEKAVVEQELCCEEVVWMKKSCGGEFIGPHGRGVWICHANLIDREGTTGTKLVT
jgi:hypothetical protein